MAYEYLTNPEQSKKTLIHIINSRVSKAHPQIQAVYFKNKVQYYVNMQILYWPIAIMLINQQ